MAIYPNITVPPITTYDASVGLENHQIHGSTYALEDTCRLTQALIDIYPSFLESFITHPLPQIPNTNQSCPSNRLTNTDIEPSQLSLPDPCGSKKAHENSLDHSSILLIISAHLRLIGIYEVLLHHMRMCFKPSGTDMNSRHVTLETARIPKLKVGGYVPPPSAAVPMQMLLFVNFGSQLFRFATDLACGIQKHGAESTPEDFSPGRNENSDIRVLTGAAEQAKNGALKVAQGLEEMRHQSLQMTFTII
ncbi:hypothetical protein HYFRA_00004317 [Hymenoscyphus fraxineus]|uniref:Uncharacterized protein n=1 Tax=Hymenoscyphus fraxineus TaxID=746836 RepID=A0A9N9PNH0_9HELO|nr:hypothetical protein HYFRA_00004317 [Hymenoscyphus fraxineus]